MENEPPTISVQGDGWASKRGRIMGKLFGRDRDRKVSQDEPPNPEDLNDFLRGPSDTLQVAHAGPPMLAKLDIRNASRYPQALDVHGAGPGPGGFQQDPSFRPRSRSPRVRLKKGLVVRFVDTHPDIIGEGGEECQAPTIEISKQKPRSRPPATTAATAPARPLGVGDKPTKELLGAQAAGTPFAPGPLRRTQTGYSTIADAPEPEIPAGRNTSARYLDNPVISNDEKRRSFIETHQAEMREAEGLAFARAVRTETHPPPARAVRVDTDPSQQPAWEKAAPSAPRPEAMADGLTESPTFTENSQISQPHALDPSSQSPQPPLQGLGPAFQASRTPGYAQEHPKNPPVRQPLQQAQYQPYALVSHTQEEELSESPERLKKTPLLDLSPSSTHSAASSFSHPYAAIRQGSRASERDSALTSSPRKASSSLHDVVVAAADDAMDTFVDRTRHLFELFRLHSESVRPLVACSTHELARAGLWWFLTGRLALENAIKERPTSPEHQQKYERAKQQAYADLAKGYWLSEEIIPDLIVSNRTPPELEVDEAGVALVSNLRKLAMSMKRNDFLPPEEAFLPQTVDTSIWIEYPQINQDIVSILWGSSNSSLTQPKPTTSGMSLVEGLPLGDSPLAFCFGRFRTDVYLMEQGRESQHLFFPCYLSIVRPQTQPDIVFVIASQNGAVQLRITGSRNFGPTWEDVRWRSETYSLEVGLPRGFILSIRCSQQHYKMLWNMYDYSAKVHSSLYPQLDENGIFRSTLRAFQHFDNDPQSRQFPKELIPGCEVGLFERVSREGSPVGPRSFHRGYRIAVVTGTRTKTLSGINHSFTPQAPVQYEFLRRDANDPALSLKFQNGRSRGNMVLSFGDEQERLRFHSLLIGTALHRDEHTLCEVPLQGVWFSERYGDAYQKSLKVISALPWQRVRVINHDNDGDRPPNVFADKLRIVFEFKDGTFTDRVNVAPGEFRLRLDVRNPSCMMVFRQPQADVTIAVMEAKVPRELPPGLSQGLETLRQSPTIRTLMFSSLADLHEFQTAVTGYNVLFDGIASAFAIARRRMVVPIHKKWEAGATRIQLVQQDGAVQLLAFFDDFAHGQCMGFNLKGTDVFEVFGRGGKAGLKIDDAKFPLPKLISPDNDSAQVAGEAAFVCLDLPELPGEHDDISILFDDETERDKFTSCLPAPVKGSRLQKQK